MKNLLLQMPIHIRLNGVIAALLLFSLAGLVLALLMEARPRVIDENASMMSFTEAHIRATRGVILASADPAERLGELVDDLSRLRHIRVFLLPPGDSVRPPAHSAAEGDWLTRLLFGSAEPKPVRIAFALDGQDLGTVLLEANPLDEMNEVRSAIDGIVATGILLAITVFGITSWMIWRELRPIHKLCTAMGSMESGNFDIDLGIAGAPEIRAISRSVESLASALRTAEQENARLSAQLIRLQDDERRAIARELHDELGPHLYSARVRATALQTTLQKPEADLELAGQNASKLLSEIAALQLVNRRVLQQLSPAGLSELGIDGALMNLTSRWREEHPDIHLDVAIGLGETVLDETAELTVYRVVQEALTNAYRHSKASSIGVEVDVGRDEVNNGAGTAPTVIRIRVEDDGKGLSVAPEFGYGLRGMRERVTALGGKVSVRTGKMGGVQLTAQVPLLSDRKSARQPA